MGLQLIIYTPTGRQALDLSPSSSLDLEAISPFFATDLSEDTYSLPLDLPITNRNKKILGAPEMLESKLQDQEVYWSCDVLENGQMVLSGVKLTILKITTDFNYKSGVYSISISGANSLFGSMVKNKKLSNTPIIPVITFNTSSRNFAYEVMTDQNNAYKDMLSFVPVHRPKYFMDDRSDYDNERMYNDIVNNVFLHGNTWTFDAPDSIGTNPAMEGDASGAYAAYRTIPFFKLTYVIKAIFKHFGYSVTGTFFEIADIHKVVIDNNCSIETYRWKQYDINRRIVPQHHLPDISIASFLNTICTMFNLRLGISNINKVAELSVKQIPTIDQVVDITAHTLSEFESEAFTDLAYNINFEFDSADEMTSNFIKETIPNYRGQHISPQVAQAATYTPPLQDGDVIYSIRDNYYYVYRMEYNKFVYFAEGMQNKHAAHIQTDEQLKVTTSPLLKWVTVTDTGQNIDLNMCSSTGAGSYNSFRQVAIKNEYKLKLFIADTYQKLGVYPLVPLSTNSTGSLSLSYSHPDIGIYDVCFKRWHDELRDARVIKASIVGIKEDIDTLMHSFIKIKHTLFLIKKISYAIGNSNIMEVELVKY